MERVRITNVEQKFYVDEEGLLYSDLYIEMMVQPVQTLQYVDLSVTIFPTSSSFNED